MEVCLPVWEAQKRSGKHQSCFWWRTQRWSSLELECTQGQWGCRAEIAVAAAIRKAAIQCCRGLWVAECVHGFSGSDSAGHVNICIHWAADDEELVGFAVMSLVMTGICLLCHTLDE